MFKIQALMMREEALEYLLRWRSEYRTFKKPETFENQMFLTSGF